MTEAEADGNERNANAVRGGLRREDARATSHQKPLTSLPESFEASGSYTDWPVQHPEMFDYFRHALWHYLTNYHRQVNPHVPAPDWLASPEAMMECPPPA